MRNTKKNIQKLCVQNCLWPKKPTTKQINFNKLKSTIFKKQKLNRLSSKVEEKAGNSQNRRRWWFNLCWNHINLLRDINKFTSLIAHYFILEKKEPQKTHTFNCFITVVYVTAWFMALCNFHVCSFVLLLIITLILYGIFFMPLVKKTLWSTACGWIHKCTVANETVRRLPLKRLHFDMFYYQRTF